jgi:hypothetical protein
LETKIITAILAVLLLAGCAGTQCSIVVNQKDALIKSEFYTSYDTIPVGDIVSLRLTMQNMGTSKVTNLNATLWSLNGFSLIDGSEKTQVANFALAPPDLTICSPGDVQVFNWNLRSGCDPMNAVLSAYVDYDYSSEGWAKMFMVHSDEATRTGGQFDEKGENHPSAGPLQIKIETVQTEPVIISKANKYFDARINFENTGHGLVGSRGTGDIGTITIRTEGPCLIQQDDKNQNSYGPLKIFKGKEVGLSSSKQEALKVVHLVYDSDREYKENEVTAEIPNFIKDYCVLRVEANYHYHTFEEVSNKVGIYGSNEEVERCRGGMSAAPIAKLTTSDGWTSSDGNYIVGAGSTIQFSGTSKVYAINEDFESPQKITWLVDGKVQTGITNDYFSWVPPALGSEAYKDYKITYKVTDYEGKADSDEITVRVVRPCEDPDKGVNESFLRTGCKDYRSDDTFLWFDVCEPDAGWVLDNPSSITLHEAYCNPVLHICDYKLLTCAGTCLNAVCMCSGIEFKIVDGEIYKVDSEGNAIGDSTGYYSAGTCSTSNKKYLMFGGDCYTSPVGYIPQEDSMPTRVWASVARDCSGTCTASGCAESYGY